MEPIVINNPFPKLLKLIERLRKFQMENIKKLICKIIEQNLTWLDEPIQLKEFL